MSEKDDALVEKVAEELYDSWCTFHGVAGTSLPWPDIGEEERDACIFEARAAIAVLRPMIRAEALREAAKICSSRYMGDNNREDMEARRCAAAILALIDKEQA